MIRGDLITAGLTVSQKKRTRKTTNPAPQRPGLMDLMRGRTRLQHLNYLRQINGLPPLSSLPVTPSKDSLANLALQASPNWLLAALGTPITAQASPTLAPRMHELIGEVLWENLETLPSARIQGPHAFEQLEGRAMLSGNPIVSIDTNFGDFDIELFQDQAPGTVENFLDYVEDEDFVNSFFHRLVPEFILQGGGFTATNSNINDPAFQINNVPTDPPIQNEFGLSNTRGTVAMAKLGGNADSATSQWFINLADNSANLDNQNGGFTVFGEVVDMTVVDQFATFETQNLEGDATNAPVNGDEIIIIESTEVGYHDLVQFAKDLSDAGIRFFGAAWCQFCTTQKELFEDGAQFLDFIEVTNPDRSLNEIGIEEGIQSFPTWDFGNGIREISLLSLEQISQISGIDIPLSDKPYMAPLEDVILLDDSPLHIPIENYDPNDDSLTVSVSSSDPVLVQATLTAASNQSARFTFSGWGDILVHMFEERVPRPTSVVKDLAQQDIYDNTIFHRVINGFMIQGGDPTGTGFGDPNLPNFDDQFHVELQHNRSDIASFAKSSDDTNSSQVFFTEVPNRYLDFNHSVWGIITEGSSNRESISNIMTDSSDRPTIDVLLENVTIENDTENRVLMLKAVNGSVGEADVTVTVSDPNGNEFTRTFHVTVEADTMNSTPFLEDITEIPVVPGQTTVVPLRAYDVESDDINFYVDEIPDGWDVSYQDTTVPANDSVATAHLALTPPADFTGSAPLQLSVTSAVSNISDQQAVSVVVADRPAPPTGIDLVDQSDTGFSSTDNITQLSQPTFLITGITPGALVALHRDNTMIAEQTATSTEIEFSAEHYSALDEGVASITATQQVDEISSIASSPLLVTIDTTILPFSSLPPENVNLDVPYVYDITSLEEGDAGFQYSLEDGPTDMTIDATDGTILWTPTQTQIANHAVIARGTDAAGNTLEQGFTIRVNGPPQLDVIDNATVHEGDLLAFTVSAFDPNQPDDVLLFTLDPGAPTGATIDENTGLFEWMPTEIHGPGQFAATVRVEDEAGLFDSAAVTINVLEDNQGPLLTNFSDQTIIEGQLFEFTATASDADLPSQPLTFSLGSAPEGVTIHPTSGLISWTPTDAQAPSLTSINVIVTDSEGGFDEQLLNVKVQDTPVPPVLATIDNQTVNEETEITITITATDENLDADNLTYALGDGAPAGATINKISQTIAEFRWTPTETDGPDKFDIPIVVSDSTPGQALTDSTNFQISVAEVNRPPILQEVSPQSVIAGRPLSLSLLALDPDLPTNDLAFSVDPGAPAGLGVDANTGVVTWTPALEFEPTTVEIIVRVSDGEFESAQTVTIDVLLPPLPPELDTIDDQQVDEGATLTLTAVADDPNFPDDILRYELGDGAPTAASMDPLTGLFSWTPTEIDGPGKHTVTVRVMDREGFTDTTNFIIDVAEVNQPPFFESEQSLVAFNGHPFENTFKAVDPDIPSTSLIYQLDESAPEGATIDELTGIFSWTPSVEQSGDFLFYITARETTGTVPLSATDEFTITTINFQNLALDLLQAARDRQTQKGQSLIETADTSMTTPASDDESTSDAVFSQVASHYFVPYVDRAQSGSGRKTEQQLKKENKTSEEQEEPTKTEPELQEEEIPKQEPLPAKKTVPQTTIVEPAPPTPQNEVEEKESVKGVTVGSPAVDPAPAEESTAPSIGVDNVFSIEPNDAELDAVDKALDELLSEELIEIE